MDVVPYDENRVLLVDGDGNDYINATFINGYQHSPKAYIAAQGPIGDGELNQGRREKTVDHFWSMIWQERIECIVMLTQIVESLRPKCAQYWPETVNDRLELSNGLQVILMAETMEESFIRRQFHLEIDGQRRDVVQWHFREWLDSKAPEKSEHLLRFISRIRQTQPSSPILVHCSAGVGRTGVYVALDILLQQIRDHDMIDVFNCVANLRRQRVRMVQTVEQYITIYNEIEIAIKEKLSPFAIKEKLSPFAIKEKFSSLDSKPELSPSVNTFHSKM